MVQGTRKVDNNSHLFLCALFFSENITCDSGRNEQAEIDRCMIYDLRIHFKSVFLKP